MIRCQHCGYENSNENYLCARCMERLPLQERNVQQEYNNIMNEHNRQVEEAQKSIYKKAAVVGIVIFLIAILVIWVQDSPKVDSRLTGTWRQNQFPYTTWTFTQSGRVSISAMDNGEVVGSSKYKVEDGKLFLWPDNPYFANQYYTYQFGTATDNSGNTHEVLIIDGGDMLFIKQP